jgi:hypothetical protein
MSFVQAIRLLDLQNVMEANAPGDPRLWDVLNDSLGGIHVQHMNLLCLEWDKQPERVPGLEEWTDWLSLEGNLGVSLSGGTDTHALQKRNKGYRSHALEQLTFDWLEMQGFALPKRLWLADNYVVIGSGDPSRIFESLRGLMGLGSKSGIWDENTEECRLLMPNQDISWPYHFEEEFNKVELTNQVFLSAMSSGINILSSKYSLTENTGRGTPGAVLCESVFDIWKDFRNPERPHKEASAPITSEILSRLGPEHFVVGLPKNALYEKIRDSLRSFVEEQAALADRYPGVIRYREQSSTILHLESFPDVASHFRSLKIPSSPNSEENLYAIAPWDSRNQVMCRRIEHFLRVAAPKLVSDPSVLPGTLNWIEVYLHSILDSSGWKISEAAAKQLLEWNTTRMPSSNILFFWSATDPDSFKKDLFQYGLQAIPMGQGTTTESFCVGEQTVPVVEIPLDEIRKEISQAAAVQAQWVYKDQKSPTYGFEKAAIFPDRFLKRMSQVGIRTEIQKSLSWTISSTPVHRDHLMKTKTSQPITYLRWTDGQNTFVDALASVDSVAEYDPKALGEWAVDLALRGLVCKGVDPRSEIFAQAWMAHPDATDQPASAERYGAFYLANLGLKTALEEFGIHFGGINVSGTYSRSRPYLQELVVRLRAPLSQSSRPVFPGFRMAEETLYVLGPRPAFMDAGTRLLPHFRVVSNHITKLNMEIQKELYLNISKCISSGLITVARPVGQSGALGAVLEMALWGNIGVALKPGLSTIELFSGAPGRVLVGVLPQDVKMFETFFRQELICPFGESSGDRIFGQPLAFYREPEGGQQRAL